VKPLTLGKNPMARRAVRNKTSPRRLIEKHGYWRRKEELEDAELVIGRLA